LAVTAQQAIALEDSPNGVQAAKRALLYCVAVPNSMTRGLDFDQADLQVDSLAELSLDQLLDAASGT
jgi:beta-phosphoglucomutase-like phosphatase (HAD superfamily)